MLRIYLAHGASGDAASMAPWVDGLRERGFEAHAVQLPVRLAEEAVAAYEAQVPDEPGTVIGGQSYGGRVASLAVAGVRKPGAAERTYPYAGLVCLSYPLHPPGKPHGAAERAAHWPRIDVPALLLSGTGDPFARIELLEAAMPTVAHGRLVTYPKLGHTLKTVRPDALDRIAEFLAEIASGSAPGRPRGWAQGVAGAAPGGDDKRPMSGTGEDGGMTTDGAASASTDPDPSSDDGRPRCGWGDTPEPLYRAYHDVEWGVPVRDERHLFELLILEGAQAGLSWWTILRKREAYRRAFAGFDPAAVAGFGDADAERLLADPGIVRNRAKIAAAIDNARATLDLHAAGSSLVDHLWSFVDGRPVVNAWTSQGGIPAETDASRAMSRDLKARGFRFVGPTICYALMQAAGLVNDHVVTCFRYAEVREGR